MKQFQTALISVVQEVCEILRGQEMPMREWTRIERSSDNKTTSFPVEMRPDVSRLMTELYRKWEKLTSLNKLRDVVEKNPKLSSAIFIDAAGKPITSETAKQSWTLNFLVGPFLGNYFSTLGAIYFDQRTVESIIDALIQKLRSPFTRYISISPLINLELTKDVIEVAPGVRLRNLSTEQLEKWLNASFFAISASPISGMDLIDLKCAAEITNEAFHDRSQTKPLINNLVDLIRLLTNRNVYVAFTEEHFQDESRPLYNQSSQSWGPSLRLQGLTATIDDSTGTSLINLWRRLQNCPNTEKVTLAFKRWSETAERLVEEDKLIDYWIALESLFAADCNQEVKFRASLRIAVFLGETPDKRKEIYNYMRSSYDWRSAIVHGDFRKPKKLKELNKKCTLSQATEITRSYLRESILRLLEANEELDPTAIELRLLGK